MLVSIVNTQSHHKYYEIYDKEIENFNRSNCDAETETPLKCKITNEGMHFIGSIDVIPPIFC